MADPAPDPAVLADQERKLLDKYGKLPMAKKSVLGHRLKERKYFDSGDYAMSKAGKSSPNTVGSAHPTPDMIPHSHPATSVPTSAAPPAGTLPGTSPAKESSLVKETSAQAEGEGEEEAAHEEDA
ncbi:hypothetical protein AMAG_07017 [Allomyces macrogynus ATCC 38327]|uniref:mRNA stability protein n=1 Tax=Allomyces macrogynus (strain ATCC 38327) TaxID=578462 RepID=A0A0L0SFX5_ALLM3|nr:hypothetical protein AMAG_07017 [Allomyces macrogynus ATCC 38327]|eukprot:KNE61275.1 hypothetical protein AMAG_07017 [Allomyces macrogynus ATCC 38327]